MKKKFYSAAVIGTGRIGFSLCFDKKREQPASHTAALLSNRRIKIEAGIDTNAEKLSVWKKFVQKKTHRNDIKTFSSINDALKSGGKFDIIVVAVNERSHFEETLKAIEAKPHLIILEKPVALNSDEGEKILARAKEAGVPVMVNHERRFSADYIKAKSLLKKIGEIQSVTAELDSGLRIYAKEFESEGTYSLIHDGTHLVDIVRFLLGAKLKSPHVTGIFRDEKNMVRNFTAFYEEETFPVTIKMSGRSKFFEFRIEILGTLGKIIVGNGIFEFYMAKESKLYEGFKSLARKKVRLQKKTAYFSNMVKNAVSFLDGKTELFSPLEDALEDLRILEKIKEKF